MSSANGGVGAGTAVFGLPTAWRAAPGEGEGARDASAAYVERVEYGDLVGGLSALAGICGTEPVIVLLAAHVKVLSMLGEADDRHTEVDLGTGVRRLPVLRTAATWQELVLRVAKAVRGAGVDTGVG
ncbi:hypothetical protein, partial [Streptomyces sp. NPDC058855]|uniref:hypothetical protein n=1 Tax=Streptomyces sp. NPDC058855 TaxID=3346651 RepID=UPI0036C1267A